MASIACKTALSAGFVLSIAVSACETGEVPQGAASLGASLIGEMFVESGTELQRAPEDITITIGGVAHTVRVAPDLSFALHQIPNGDLEITLDADGASTTFSLDDVAPVDLFTITVIRSQAGLHVDYVQRTARMHPPMTIYGKDGVDIEILDDHVSFMLAPGAVRAHIVIAGDFVQLFGDAAQSCDENERSIINGDLVLQGKNIEVRGVGVRGDVIITGQHVRVHDACDGLWETDLAGVPLTAK
jgi:hypothetical protein